MPTVFRHNGARFFFNSNEGNPREPIHVHVQRGDGEAKFWRQPSVGVSDSAGFNRKELAELLRIVQDRRAEIGRGMA